MNFPCAWCEKPVQQKLDRFDIRLEARRTDAKSRPHVKTILGLCREHTNELFAAVDAGRVVIELNGDVVKVKVDQGTLI